MELHSVRVHPADRPPAREDQLAWKLAERAAAHPEVVSEVIKMVENRIVDSFGVAVAALDREPVRAARSQAAAHPYEPGAAVIGHPQTDTVSPEWAAWANGTAIRELDFHDTFLAADYAHPADTIAPILAVCQHTGRSGADLLRGILAGYETQISLVKGICLHEHAIDHPAHLGPAQAAGIGAALDLDASTIYQAIQHAVHVSFATRQGRKGLISSWKANAPGHTGKLAVEAIDRAMRGQHSPSPIYEGADSVIAAMLGGPDAEYRVPLPALEEPRRQILESYTKEHSAEYQAQALIDLAFKLRSRIEEFEAIDEIVIHTSRHTHEVIGTGSNDPEKFDPSASRETLDHSIMYIFAVALEDGRWHHEESYHPERASRPETVRLWKKIRTREESEWTERYHESDPDRKAFGGRVEVRMQDGRVIEEEQAVADAHPNSDAAFRRGDYIEKFDRLTEEWIGRDERDRVLDRVDRLPELSAEEVRRLTPEVDGDRLEATRTDEGIFS